MLLLDKNQSDNLIFMKRMTATEVARNFSAVLDAVEQGDEIEITRGKKVVATLRQEAPKKTVSHLLEVMQEHQAKYGPMDDETYAIYQEILAERDAPHNQVGGPGDYDPWDR